MLVEKNGRTFSVRTTEELDSALQKELASLSPEEREALNIVLQELRQKNNKMPRNHPGQKPKNPGLIEALADTEYKHVPVDMRTFIKDPYYLGNTCDSLYPRYLDDLIELFEGGYNECVFCLHPDTPVPLLDGAVKTVQELAADWEANPQPFWVYGVEESGKVVPAQAEFPRQTGMDDYYRVTLDDGTSFTGNARHQMVLRDGSKRMIRDMKPGDSIMPFETRLSSRSEGRRISGYEMVRSLDTEGFRYTHALVEEDKNGPVDSKAVTVHHKNFDKRDNRPENLEQLPWKAHADLHHRERMAYLAANPEVHAALKERARRNASDLASPLREGHRAFMRSAQGKALSRSNLSKAELTPDVLRERAAAGRELRWNGEGADAQRRAASERLVSANAQGLSQQALAVRWSDPSQREAARRRAVEMNKARRGVARRSDVTAEAVQRAVAEGAITVAAAAETLACSKTRVLRALSDGGVDPKAVFTRRRNHYVVSIEKVGHGPVYCMTVPRTTNFAICTLKPDGSYERQGVFSSNTGAIGIGKSFFCSIGLCRILYEISCLKDPHKSFGLAKDTNITLAAFSVNEELATKVVFENIKTKITASPYFQEHFSFEATKKELRFPHNIWVAPRATTDTSALGLNVISAFMDEGNFLPKKGKHADAGAVDHADVIYSSLKRRMKSRFERKGKLPGILFIASSKTTTEDFVSRRLREAKDDPSIFVRDYALWDVKPDDYYSAKKFQVMVGNESAPSKILDPVEVQSVRASMPEGTLIIDVPEDFRHDFESNLEGSIKDLAGVSVVSVSPFIQRREKLVDAVEQDKRFYGPDRHPFSTLEYDSSKGGHFVWGRMVQNTREQVVGSAFAETARPIINPHASRHIHIDIGLRHDALGFCMSHIAGHKDVVRRGENGQHLERAPIYVVDLILRVVPPPGDEIILGDVRRLIYELSGHGYSITSVTTDSYQSTDMVQQLNQKGFNSRIVSVDTSTHPYENLKTALYEDRVFMYDYPILLQELRQLQRDFQRKKIDHPNRGSKDCSDALAGCLWTLSQLQFTAPLPIIRHSAYSTDSWLPDQYAAFAGGTPGASESVEQEQYEPLPFFRGNDYGWRR